MNYGDFNEQREKYNKALAESDHFFEAFGFLDDGVYGKGAIPKKYKELMGVVVSIISKCEECIAYHLQNCKEAECSKKEIIEAVKIAVIGGGSVTFPWARKTIKMVDELGIE